MLEDFKIMVLTLQIISAIIGNSFISINVYPNLSNAYLYI